MEKLCKKTSVVNDRTLEVAVAVVNEHYMVKLEEELCFREEEAFFRGLNLGVTQSPKFKIFF